MAYIGRQLARGENKLFDDISSSFNGSTTTFTLAVSSVATATATPYQLFVSLGGVMQKPNTDFTTAGNQITFTTAPAAGLSCWIMMQGDTIDQAAIPDASVTPSKISGTNFAFSGDLRLKDADGSHYVGFASPSTVSTNKVWTLPAADGSASQYLQTNGSGVLTWASVSIGGATGIDFNDNVKARWGTGNDLEIFHNGTNSKITNSTGTLYVEGTTEIWDSAGSETLAKFIGNGAVELYHNNVKKIETSAAGVSITGALTVSTNATITGDLTVSGTTTTINTQTLDVEDKNIVIGKVSSPSDTTADGGGWTLKGATDKTFNWVNSTDAWTSSEHIHLGDNKKLIVGTGQDLSIYHDSVNSRITNSTGGLIVDTGSCTFRNAAGNETLAYFAENSKVELYFNNSKKIETTNTGIDVTGSISVNGAALSTAPTITATASGSISANAPVIVNSSGQVKGITQTSASLGNVDDISTASNAYFYGGTSPITYDASQDLLIASVRYSSTVYTYGGTVSGTDTSWGSDASHGSGRYYPTIASDGNGYALLVYKASQCHGRIIRFQGTSQTVGSETQIQDNSSQCEVPAVLHLDGAYFAVVYNDEQPNPDEGKCRICQRGSGTSTSFTMGSVTSFTPGGAADDPYNFRLVKVSGTKFVILWSSGTTNSVYAIVGTRSGTSVSFGTKSTVVTGTHGEQPTIAYDSLNDQLVAAYRNYLKIGTITGTTISWGSAIQFSTNNTLYHALAFSPGGQLLMGYKDSANAGKYRTATYNAAKDNFTFDSEAFFNTGGTNKIFFSYMESGKVAIMYQNTSASSKAQTVIRQMASTDLNQKNFIGFSSAGYTNGQTATINVVGNTTTQSGLTPGEKYYVQDDATLGTSKDTFDVIAGKALTSTSLLITPA